MRLTVQSFDYIHEQMLLGRTAEELLEEYAEIARDERLAWEEERRLQAEERRVQATRAAVTRVLDDWSLRKH